MTSPRYPSIHFHDPAHRVAPTFSTHGPPPERSWIVTIFNRISQLLLVVFLAATTQSKAEIVKGPVTYNGNTYYLLAPKSWTASQAEAVSLGGNLASVNDFNEYVFIIQEFFLSQVTDGGNDARLWLGLRDVNGEGTYPCWVSGQAVTYAPWVNGPRPPSQYLTIANVQGFQGQGPGVEDPPFDPVFVASELAWTVEENNDLRYGVVEVNPLPRIILSRDGTSQPASLIASCENWSVGSAGVGQQITATVTIINPGSVAVNNIVASVPVPGNADFQVTTPAPATSLAPGDSTTIHLVFSPQATGQRAAKLQVATDGVPSVYSINLRGTGTDATPPVIAPPAVDLVLECGAADQTAAINAWLGNHGGAAATDESGTVNWSHNFSGLSGSELQTILVTFTATDPSGNSSTTTANLVIQDTTLPEITTGAMGLTLECGSQDFETLLQAWLTSHGGAASTDTCGEVSWSHDFTTLPTACGSVIVTFTAADPSANQATTQALLAVNDTVPPVLTIPATDLTVESDGAGNAAELNAWLASQGGAVATDPCGTVSWVNDFTGLANNLPQSFSVTFSAMDSCGNSTPISATFTIEDTTPPAITSPAVDFYGDCGEWETQIATFLASRGGAVAVDIAGPVTWTHDYNGMLPDCEAYTTVTFTATDTVGLTASTSARFFIFPPGAIWIGPATGTWTTAAGWRSQVPTQSLDAYVDLFDFQDTTVSVSAGTYSVKNLHVGQGDLLRIGGSSTVSFTVAGDTIRNAGEVHIQGSSLRIGGATTLTGDGRLVLTGDGSNRIERGNSSSLDVLTVSSDQEITTSGATEAEYQHTSIHAGLINHGTVTADTGGMTLYLEPKSNHGTFRAINGGMLRMQTPVDNVEGTLSAGAGSSLWLQNTLSGGMVTGAGRLLMNSTAGLTGPLTLDSELTTAVEGGTTNLIGTIINDGQILISVPGGGSAASLAVNGAATLEGSGKVILQGAGNRRIMRANSSVLDVLTVGEEQEITATAATIAEYQNGAIHAGLINHGTITADGGGLTLYSNSKTNLGLFRAVNGGLLRMETPVNNTEGTLFAGENSILKLENTLTGGIVTGTGRLVTNSSAGLVGPITLDTGLTFAIEGSTTALSGNINLNGQLHLGVAGSATGATLDINGAVSLTGTGGIVLQGNNTTRLIERASSLVSDVLTLHAGLEITTTAGTVASSQRAGIKAGLVNHGMITADEGGLALSHNNKTNHGTFRAINGGNLVITGSTLTNYNATTDTLTGGRWEVISSGATTSLDIPSSPITTIAANTFVCLSGSHATFPQLSTLNTVAGTLCLENGKSFTTSGNLALPGSLEFGLTDGSINGFDAGRIFVNGNVNFTGATIHIRDRGITAGIYEIVRWTGTPTGMPMLGSLPPGLDYKLLLDVEEKVLRLQIIDNLPEIIAVHHNAATGTTTIDYQSVVDVVHSVKGTRDFVVYDVLPDTEPGTGGLMQYIHPSEDASDRYFYLFATDD